MIRAAKTCSFIFSATMSAYEQEFLGPIAVPFSSSDFYVKIKVYAQYLIDCGHNRAHVNRVFEEVGNMQPRTQALSSGKERPWSELVT